MAAKAVLVVTTNCSDPAREQEYQEWYLGTHLPDMLETYGVVSARLFNLASPPGDGQGKFLALYDLDTDDTESVHEAVRQMVTEKREQGRMNDCLSLVSLTYYTALSP